jgi:uncharacterized protein YceK
MKTAALVLVCVLGLAGCKSVAEETAKRNKPMQELAGQAEQVAKADDAQCKSHGLQIGTAAYADCRLKLKSLRL